RRLIHPSRLLPLAPPPAVSLRAFAGILSGSIFPFVFLLWSSEHRVLHSFPTRRSSDLACTPTRRLSPPPPSRRRPRARGRRRDGDRKSTRLNSSHVSISYAVFCLKKKKIGTYVTFGILIFAGLLTEAHIRVRARMGMIA